MQQMINKNKNMIRNKNMMIVRNLSTVKDPLLKQLYNIIEYILYSNKDDGTNIEQILDKKILLSGRYVLSPLKVIFLKESYMQIYFSYCFEYYNPLLTIPALMDTTDPNIKIAVLPTKEDTFLLLGLSQLLLRLSGRITGINECFLMEMEKELYSNLQIKEQVNRVYKLDLKDSLHIIPNSKILSMIIPLVGEGSAVYNLISTFLNLDMVDGNHNLNLDMVDGNHKADDISKLSKLILPLGDITMVLFDIVLMELDRELKKRFSSSIRFYRFIDEVYILTNNDGIFDEKAGYALLEELGLAGKIESIGPGDASLLCRRSRYNPKSYTHSVYLDNDKYVRVKNHHSYPP